MGSMPLRVWSWLSSKYMDIEDVLLKLFSDRCEAGVCVKATKQVALGLQRSRSGYRVSRNTIIYHSESLPMFHNLQQLLLMTGLTCCICA